MTRPLAALVLVGTLLLSGAAVRAQDAQAVRSVCPAGLACVVYQNDDGSEDTFAFDPDEGVYQEVVVAEITTTIRTQSGESTGPTTVMLAGFLGNGDTYELVKEHTEKQAGIYNDAKLGDSFGLAELH